MADPIYRWSVGTAVNQEMPRTLGLQTGITYTVTGLPEGVIFNPVTHRLIGMPVSKDRGAGAIVATAPLPSTSTATQNFQWVVFGMTFVGPEFLEMEFGVTQSTFIPIAWPPWGNTYTVSGDIPTGMVYTPAGPPYFEHTLEGTPTTAGTGTLVIEGMSATTQGTIRVPWEVTRGINFSVTEMEFSWDTTQWVSIPMPQVREVHSNTTYSISGLPVGIIYRDSDHRLVGSPIAAGSGTGTFTATLGSETTDIPLIWNVGASPITGDPHIYAFPRDPEPRGLYEINISNAASTTRIDTLPMLFSRQMSLVDHNGILFGIHDREFWRVSPSNPADSVQIATLTEHVGHHTAARSDGTLIHIYTDTASFTLDPAAIVDGQLAPVNLNVNPPGDFIHDGIEINGQYYYFDLLNNQRWRIWKLNAADPSQSTSVGEFPEIGVHIGVAALGGQVYVAGERVTGGEPHDYLWIANNIEFPSNLTLIGEFPTAGTHEFHFCQNMATFTAPPQAPSFYTDSIDFAWDTILEVDYALPRLLNEPVGTTYAVSGLPAGVTFDSTNHELEGTPERMTVGTNGTGTLTATHGSDTYTIDLNWDIRYRLWFPTDTLNTPAWPTHVAVDYELPRVFHERTGLTYTLTGNIPAGITYDAATHRLSGTPTTGGTDMLTLTAAYLGEVRELPITWTVTAIAFPETSYDLSWDILVAVSEMLPRISPEEVGTTYFVTGLPSGVVFNAGTHTLSGMPAPLTNGTTGIATLSANLVGGGVVSVPLNWSIAVFNLMFADASTDVAFDTTQEADYALPRVNNEQVGTTYAVTSLPAGITYNAMDHTLEGTPMMDGTGTAVLTATFGLQTATTNLVWEVTTTTGPEAGFYALLSEADFAGDRYLYRIDENNLTATLVAQYTSSQSGFKSLAARSDGIYSWAESGLYRLNINTPGNSELLGDTDPSATSSLSGIFLLAFDPANPNRLYRGGNSLRYYDIDAIVNNVISEVFVGNPSYPGSNVFADMTILNGVAYIVGGSSTSRRLRRVDLSNGSYISGSTSLASGVRRNQFMAIAEQNGALYFLVGNSSSGISLWRLDNLSSPSSAINLGAVTGITNPNTIIVQALVRVPSS